MKRQIPLGPDWVCYRPVFKRQDTCNNTHNTHNTQYFKVTVIPEQAENILAKKEFDLLGFQISSPIATDSLFIQF